MSKIERFKRNISAIADVLTEIGAHSVVAEYSGSGDSGDCFDILLTGADVSIVATKQVKRLIVESHYNPIANSWVENEAEEIDAGFNSAVKDLCWDAVELSGNSGWENNEGGSGSFTVTSEATAQLEHCNNFGGSNSESFELTDQFEDQVKPLIDAMNAVGVTSVAVEYEGGGDSGGVETFFADEAAMPDMPEVVGPITTWGKLPEGTYGYTTEVKAAPFISALERLLWDAVSRCGHGGWENNEGGRGSLNLNADGALNLEHTSYYEDRNSDTYTWGKEGEVEEAAT